MKIVFPVEEDDKDAFITARFGRSKKFMVIETENEEIEVIDNKVNLFAQQGAGIQSAVNISKTEPDAVILINCGPKAFKVLAEAGIKVYKIDKAMSVKDALQLFKEDKLEAMQDPNVEEHWI